MFYERNKEIAIMILSGTTYHEVAKEFSLAPERVRQITAAMCEKVDPDIFFSARKGVASPTALNWSKVACCPSRIVVLAAKVVWSPIPLFISSSDWRREKSSSPSSTYSNFLTPLYRSSHFSTQAGGLINNLRSVNYCPF